LKQTLLDIKRQTNITTKAIAERARLSTGEVFAVETGGYSSERIAQQVIAAFNQLSGMQVTLGDIRVYLVSRQNIINYAERHRL
jgi:acetoin utilization deacetylase AcuC-like enzyme